jgi:DNA polymerase alpha-associated DNA helicase A
VSGGVERQVVEGVLLQLRQDWLSIAVDEPVDDGLGGGGLVVTRRANEVTHKRLLATLSELTRCCTASDMAGSAVVRALFGDTSPTTTTHWRASEGESESESAAHTAPADEGTPASLNTSQEHAVKFCLAGPAVSVIHGPPGTGKTTTVVELIRQLARRGQKVRTCPGCIEHIQTSVIVKDELYNETSLVARLISACDW